MKKIIVVCGPTASGKTALSVELSKKFNAEIVSSDSMQIYKEMSIGTAKPTEDERDGIVHHMMDVVSVFEKYDVSKYVQQATECIDEVFEKKKNVVLVGGTGLYIDSLINNVDFFEFDNDPEYRAYLNSLANEKGGSILVDMLAKIDRDSSERIHQNDIKRLIRALEVYKVTGKTLTELQLMSRRSRKYSPIFIGINYYDRQVLYSRIDRRVDLMIEQGLIDEVSAIGRDVLSSTSKAAIGYSDILDYLDGLVSLDVAVDSIKQKTRNYAKRQLTWFRRNDEIKWFYPDLYDDNKYFLSDVFKYVSDKLR